MKILATLCWLLFVLSGAESTAQTAIVGRVTDRATGKGLPDVTVVLKGADKITTTTADGTFSLPLAPADTSFVLIFSSVGYVSVERLVRPVDSAFISVGLTKTTSDICDLPISPAARFWLWSGAHYAPLGAGVQVRRRRYLPFDVTLAYQTNLRRNHQAQGDLTLPGSLRLARQTVSGSLHYQHIRAHAAAFRCASYQLRTSLRPRPTWPLTFQLATGYARFSTEGQQQQGLGGGLGLSYYLSRFDLIMQASAARWPGHWQWQGSVRHSFGRVEAGVTTNIIGPYAELSLSAGLALY